MKTASLLLLLLIAGWAFAQNNVVDTRQFGVKADFQRIHVSLQNNIVTAVSYTFTANDVGKVLVIKKARSYPAYSNLPLSLNAMIKSVKNGTAIIESPHLQQVVNVTNAEAYLATNNYEAFRAALAYCAANGKNKLLLSYIGTAYITPLFSKRVETGGRTDAGTRCLFSINGNLEIAGISKSQTRLKFGGEDLVYINPADELLYDLFYLNTPAGTLGVESKTFRNFTIEGADRAGTAIACDNVTFRTSYADNEVQHVLFDNVDIIANGGLDVGFTTSRGGQWNANGTVKSFCEYAVRNCNWKVYNPLTVFAQVPESVSNAINGAKKVLVENTVFDGGGTPNMRRFLNSASTNGNTLTINSPGFSFYDYNSYIPEKYRKPVVTLEEAIETTVKKVVVDVGVNRDVELNAAMPVLQSSADVYVYDKNGNETALLQAARSTSDHTIRMITEKSGTLFQPGNRIRVVFRKLQCQVTEIRSPTTAAINWIRGGQQTVENVTAIVNDDGRIAEGHTMYIHPNVSCRFKNLTIKNSLKLALHHYSGSGVRGNRLYFELDNVVLTPTSTYPLERGLNWTAPFEFSMENCVPLLPIIIKNSSIGFYQTGAIVQVSHTKLMGGQCGGGSFDACTGSIDIWGTYPTVITNCKLEGYNKLRPNQPNVLNAIISNSSFGWLAVGDVHSLTISNSRIEHFLTTPVMNQRIKLDRVTIVNKE